MIIRTQGNRWKKEIKILKQFLNRATGWSQKDRLCLADTLKLCYLLPLIKELICRNIDS